MSQQPQATLFYDGNCPLCQHEMTLLARRKSEHLRLVNIHTSGLLTAQERLAMLRRLHLQQADGKWLVGVDASVAAWRYGGLGWLLAPLRWPVLGKLVDALYTRWAERRFRKLYGTGETLCKAPRPEEAANDH